jgi:hypothetical protein
MLVFDAIGVSFSYHDNASNIIMLTSKSLSILDLFNTFKFES